MLTDGVSIVHRDGLDFVVVTVPRAERTDKPVRVYDRKQKNMVAWVRRGSGDKQATASDINLMVYDKASAADRQPIDRYGIESLCPETIARYRAVFAAQKPNSPWTGESDEDFLFHIGATSRGKDARPRLTRAGLLAFGQEYVITEYLPQYLLDYREEVTGQDRWDDRLVSQSGDWSGNVIDFYLDVTRKIQAHFKAPFGTDEYGTAHAPRNPLTEALNEAIVNALVHAYYADACTIKIIMRSQSLEVANPGSFLIDSGVAIAGGISETRNPTLMRMLGFIGASDRAGSGLQRIWKTWNEEFGESPKLVETHSPASVCLTLPLDFPQVKQSTKRRVASLEELLDSETPWATASNAAEALGISKRAAQKQLKKLFDKGLLTREKDGNSWVYRKPKK